MHLYRNSSSFYYICASTLYKLLIFAPAKMRFSVALPAVERVSALQHPLLFWSMDYTRVPAGLHSDFLDLSLDNKLAKKEFKALGKRINLAKIQYPLYMMAGSTDHITPWKACYRSTQLFGGEMRFVLTNQNHTQTICARTDNKHLKYWVNDDLPASADAWADMAVEHSGSWVFDWIGWLQERSPELTDAPASAGNDQYPVIEGAPGRYVLE